MNGTSGIRGQSPSKLGTTNQRVNYIATIRSSNKTYWAGKKSVLDNDFKQTHKSVISQHVQSSRLNEEQTVNDKRAESFGLDRYFTVEGQDLRNLFSACYITTRRIGADFMSGFFKFTYPAKRTNAVYLEFNLPEETFLDFSIKQVPSNKITPSSNRSRLEAESFQKEHGGKGVSTLQRYLTNKYILVKDNALSDTTPSQ